jgi:hypothetical protein
VGLKRKQTEQTTPLQKCRLSSFLINLYQAIHHQLQDEAYSSITSRRRQKCFLQLLENPDILTICATMSTHFATEPCHSSTDHSYRPTANSTRTKRRTCRFKSCKTEETGGVAEERAGYEGYCWGHRWRIGEAQEVLEGCACEAYGWYGFHSSPMWLLHLFYKEPANELNYRRSPSPPGQTSPPPPIKSDPHSPPPQTTPRIRHRPRMGPPGLRPTSPQTPPYPHDLPRIPRSRHCR